MHIINLFAASTFGASFLLLSGQTFAYDGHHSMSMPEQQSPQINESIEDHSAHYAMSDEPKKVVETKSQHVVKNEHVRSVDTDHSAHIKEHGGQVYQQTILESKWLRNNDGKGVLKSELESRIGTDENKIFIKVHADKAESQHTEYDAKVLYSRNVADFWDVQTGVRYRHDQNREVDENQVDAVFGLHGLAPYFFETDAYLYLGQDRQVAFNLETERDLLLTQKLILKPYLELNLVLSDDSSYAKKSGLSTAQLGVETRYEINKKVMPFIDIAYGYQRGLQATTWQQSSSSEHEWLYGAGVRFKF